MEYSWKWVCGRNDPLPSNKTWPSNNTWNPLKLGTLYQATKLGTLTKQQNLEPFTKQQNLEPFTKQQNLEPLPCTKQQNLEPFTIYQATKLGTLYRTKQQNLEPFTKQQNLEPFTMYQATELGTLYQATKLWTSNKGYFKSLVPLVIICLPSVLVMLQILPIGFCYKTHLPSACHPLECEGATESSEKWSKCSSWVGPYDVHIRNLYYPPPPLVLPTCRMRMAQLSCWVQKILDNVKPLPRSSSLPALTACWEVPQRRWASVFFLWLLYC